MRFSDIEGGSGGVAEILNDASYVSWSQQQIRKWIVEAELATIAIRPEAAAATESLALVAGTKQVIPAAGVVLYSVVRNMSAQGAPGRAIRRIDRAVKDNNDPNWHTATQSADIREYVFDDRIPRQFYVSPPAVAGTYVEIEYQKLPGSYNLATDATLTISDIYKPALVEWVLYRCFSRSDEATPDYARSAVHYNRWKELLMGKGGADAQTVQAGRQ